MKTKDEALCCEVIKEYMPYDKEISKNELIDYTGWDSRKLRLIIALLRKVDGEFIINNQSGNGYIRLSKSKSNINLMLRQIRQERSRAKKIMDNIRPMIDFVNGSTALFTERGNINVAACGN